MKEYHLECQYCGFEFNAKRKDAQYCSDSCRTMASKQRKKVVLEIEYTGAKLKQVKKQAKIAGITPESLIKQKSMLNSLDIQKYKKEIKDLEDENARLRALLSTFTNEIEPSGMLIQVEDEEDIENLHLKMSETFPDLTFDEAIVKAAFEYPIEKSLLNETKQELVKYMGLYEQYKYGYEKSLELYQKRSERDSSLQKTG